jgi:hypothetical protein
LAATTLAADLIESVHLGSAVGSGGRLGETGRQVTVRVRVRVLTR